jgi:hypothetical protein
MFCECVTMCGGGVVMTLIRGTGGPCCLTGGAGLVVWLPLKFIWSQGYKDFVDRRKLSGTIGLLSNSTGLT